MKKLSGIRTKGRKITKHEGKMVENVAIWLRTGVVNVSRKLKAEGIKKKEASESLVKLVQKMIGRYNLRIVLDGAQLLRERIKDSTTSGYMSVKSGGNKIETFKAYYQPIYKYLNKFNPKYDLPIVRTKKKPPVKLGETKDKK